MMQPFDLTKAMSGAGLCTRSNQPVRLYFVGEERLVCYAGRTRNGSIFISVDKLTGRAYPDQESPSDIFLIE